jgi:hypothetical protein
MRILTSLVVATAACSTTKAPIDDDFTDLASLDTKSDSFSYRMKIVGSLDYDQTSDAIKYTSSPRYRAVKFSGQQGDRVDAWVRSSNGGDAVAWVLDNSFRVLGSNDDADETTFDAHVAIALPASSSSTHYVVFRDYAMASAKFTVELSLPYELGCVHDDDCTAVPLGGCCPDGTLFAVNSSSVDAYAAASVCTAPEQACPQHRILDTRVAECNANACGLVAIADIACGAHSVNSHGCPDGYTCNAPGTDAAGHCVVAE